MRKEVVRKVAEQITNYKKLSDFIGNKAILGHHGANVLQAYIKKNELYDEKTELQITVELLLKRIQIEILAPEGDLTKAIKGLEFIMDRGYGKAILQVEEIKDNELSILEDIRELQNNEKGYKIVDTETTGSLDDPKGLDEGN